MNYQFDWSVIFQYRELLIQGVLATLLLSGLALVCSFVSGTLIALARTFLPRWLSWPFALITEVFRNIPPIVQFFFWFFAVGLDGLPAGVAGLSAFTASHVAELVRSGIGAIPPTQLEAARSSGLTLLQALRWVLLPQAFLRIIPPLAGEVVNVVKNSAVAMTIGYTELSFQTQEIEAQTFRGFEAATAATAIYAALGVSVLLVMHGIERMLHRDVRMGT